MKTSQSVLIALLATCNANLSEEIDMELEIQKLIAQKTELMMEQAGLTSPSTELLTVQTNCKTDPTDPSCTKAFCQKSSDNLKLAQCVKYQSCFNTESKCTLDYCEKQREFWEKMRDESNKPDLTQPYFCGQEWCMKSENSNKPQCQTCRYHETLCTYNWCHLDNRNLGTRYCQESYCDVKSSKIQCIKPTCQNDESVCTYDWCHKNESNRSLPWCDRKYCAQKENYDKKQCHTEQQIMMQHLEISRTAYKKQLKLRDDGSTALKKCEATNKIVIPKKGKTPKAVTDAIAKDCGKELKALKLVTIPFNAANVAYTKESVAYKKKFGGDDAPLLFASSFLVVCVLGCMACKLKNKRKEQGQEVNFNHDDYVAFVDSEHA